MTDVTALRNDVVDVVLNRLIELLVDSAKKLIETKWSYIAISAHGVVGMFSEKPTQGDTYWIPPDGSTYLEVGHVNINALDGTVDWRDLLVNLAPTKPQPSKMYVVVGSCGNGKLKEKWNVVAYSDIKNAQTHCENVQAAADRYYDKNDCELHLLPNIVNIQGDPKMRVDVITHTLYRVEEVLLGNHYGI